MIEYAAIEYAIIDGQGVVIGRGECATVDEMLASAPPGCTTTGIGDDEHPVAMGHYLGADGEFHPLPPKPQEWSVWSGSEWIDQRTPEQAAADLAYARTIAASRINETRGAARLRFITTLPGQDMVYIEKEREARDWVAARAESSNAPDPAEYPHLAQEVGSTAPDMDAVAQVYLNMAAMFRVFSAIIEGEAMAALNEIEAATTAEAVTAAATAFPPRLIATLAAAGAPIDL
ncbi:hypothetical protein [uncultured Paracoccus sp.]|uniref:hypothetical protein n=1 Tax=uncultured Paracoccus sp. TaxID=189685 RepID=UPI0030D79C5F|tara:strand:- start:2576 stop:3271 length:696 start_codon:yes stop_codon:yes gene_type:complete